MRPQAIIVNERNWLNSHVFDKGVTIGPTNVFRSEQKEVHFASDAYSRQLSQGVPGGRPGPFPSNPMQSYSGNPNHSCENPIHPCDNPVHSFRDDLIQSCSENPIHCHNHIYSCDNPIHSLCENSATILFDPATILFTPARILFTPTTIIFALSATILFTPTKIIFTPSATVLFTSSATILTHSGDNSRLSLCSKPLLSSPVAILSGLRMSFSMSFSSFTFFSFLRFSHESAWPTERMDFLLLFV